MEQPSKLIGATEIVVVTSPNSATECFQRALWSIENSCASFFRNRYFSDGAVDCGDAATGDGWDKIAKLLPPTSKSTKISPTSNRVSRLCIAPPPRQACAEWPIQPNITR